MDEKIAGALMLVKKMSDEELAKFIANLNESMEGLIRNNLALTKALRDSN